jgi:hypothetical protein
VVRLNSKSPRGRFKLPVGGVGLEVKTPLKFTKAAEALLTQISTTKPINKAALFNIDFPQNDIGLQLDFSTQLHQIKQAAQTRQSNSTTKSGNSQKMRAKFLCPLLGLVWGGLLV